MIISALSSITLFIFLKSFALIPCFSFSSNSVPFHVNLAIPPLPSTCTCTGSCSLLKKKNEKPKNLNTSGIKLFFYCYYAAKLGIIFDTSKYFIVLLQNLSNKIRACAIAQAPNRDNFQTLTSSSSVTIRQCSNEFSMHSLLRQFLDGEVRYLSQEGMSQRGTGTLRRSQEGSTAPLRYLRAHEQD